MRMTLPCVTALSLALLLALPAAAQQKKVYRCTADGKTVYSDAPCRQAAEVDVADPRSAADKRSAEAAVRKEEAMTDKMARERRAAEAVAAKQGYNKIPHSAAEKAAGDAATPAKAKKPKKAPEATKPVQPA